MLLFKLLWINIFDLIMMVYLSFFKSNKNKKASFSGENEAKNVKSDPAGTRTQDPYIKSVLLYQLSYGIIFTIL